MHALASGDWLSRPRVMRIATLFALAMAASILWLVATSSGTLDQLGRPLGTDFSNVWTAGHMVHQGRAADVWSWPAHFEVQRAVHHKSDVDLFGWHYPPPFLLIATALAMLPYVTALLVWQLATLAPFLWMMRRLFPYRETVLLALAAPVTLICLTHGHNGFLTALLLAGGLMLLERRPIVAGIMLGCLIYKPQFGLIVPLVLIVTGNWRATAAACGSAAVLIAATLAMWGWPVWQAFVDSLPLTRTVILEEGRTGWYKIMSPFSAARMWGTGVPTAYSVQFGTTIAAVAATVALSSRRVDPALRNAFVCAAVLISTPYVLDYDQVVLLPALGWLWLDGRRHGFPTWDKSAMAVAWAAPLFARQVAEHAFVPLGMLVPIMIGVIAIRRALIRQSAHHASRDRLATAI